MDEGKKVLFDASAYMLFEATGDSESQCFEFDSAAAKPAEVDDAQSCSFGSVCGGAWNEPVDLGCDFDSRGGDFEYWSEDEDEDVNGGGSSDEEDGVVDQCRHRAEAAKEKPVKSKGCEDSNMNERERDRQFWEACLAS